MICRAASVAFVGIFLAALICWGSAFFLSCPSSNQQTGTAQQAANQTKPNNKIGPIPSVLCAGDSTVRRVASYISTGSRDAATELTAISTVVIAAFTIVLACVSNKQADATLKTAEAALAAELPLIFAARMDMWHWQRNMDRSSGVIGYPPEDCDISIKFQNYGRSVGAVTGICIEHKVAMQLPRKPKYGVPRAFAHRPMIRPETPWFLPPTDNPTFRLSEKDRERIEQRSPDIAELWVYGYLAYLDFKGAPHKCGFCFKWHSTAVALNRGEPLGFHADGPETYIYST